nr:Ycf58 [Porphyrostromium boryanum]
MITKNQDLHTDVDNFFTMNLGNWLTQKTSYNPSSKKHKTSKTKISIGKLEYKSLKASGVNSMELPTIASRDKTFIYNISSINGGANTSSLLSYTKAVYSESNSNIYKFCKNSRGKTIEGTFELIGGVMNVSVQINQLSIEERIWFINKNLKLTKSIIRDNKHCVLISFASEIKIIKDQ